MDFFAAYQEEYFLYLFYVEYNDIFSLYGLSYFNRIYTRFVNLFSVLP